MREDVLTPEQRAFVTELEAFNTESRSGKLRLSPAQRVQRRQRARQLAARAKRLFLGMKVMVT